MFLGNLPGLSPFHGHICCNFLAFCRDDPLRQRLVAHIVAECPTTLREWDIHQAEINAIKQTIFSVTTVDSREIDPGQLRSDRIPKPTSAIVFAREFGCTKIIPIAFGQLPQMSFKCVWSL